MQYRHEIDGLRALAVVPVILFHGGFSSVAGGFIGVDVFFVISGYLITNLVLENLSAGHFSLLRFYERRARRILPALFFMMLVCVPLALWLMLPFQLVDFGRSLIGTSLFASNILFWQNSGYFSAPAAENPLLHTWSLAVEEQFYIIAPLAILFLWRMGKRGLWIGLSCSFLLSLGLAHYLAPRQIDMNFYLLPTRAWELLSGGLLALYLTRYAAPKGWLAEIAALLGLGMVVGAFTLFRDNFLWPSFYTLVPVGGTVLILLCANASNLTGRILRLRPLVGLGLISYSAYLWHFPLFAFAHIHNETYLHGVPPPPQTLMAALAVGTVILGTLSWSFIERPFRRTSQPLLPTQRGIFVGSALGALVSLAIGASLIAGGGLVGRYPPHQQAWVTMSPPQHSDYLRGRYRKFITANWRLFKKGDTRPILLLVGDSFSQDLLNMIRENKAFSQYLILADYIPGTCQIYKGKDDISVFWSKKERSFCTKLKRPRTERIRAADVIILASSWKQWAVERLPGTIKALDLRADQQIFVLGFKSMPYQLRSLIGMDHAALQGLRVPPDPRTQRINTYMRRTLPDSQFIDLMRATCDAGTACPLVTRTGDLISYDGRHLTPEGARYIGSQIFSKTRLSKFMSQTD